MTTVKIWEILGIEPTYSRQEIRRAYAEKSRQNHPEEDPEAFAELNRAYQAAMRYAQGQEMISAEEKKEMPGIRKPEEIGAVNPDETLLYRLEQAEEQKIALSRRQGALFRLEELLKDPNVCRKAETWRAFFLSEEFLREQCQEEFGKGLRQCLKLRKEDENLPRAFVTELAIAYGLYAEDEGLVNTEGSFSSRQAAGDIWNAYIERMPKGAARVLYKPENLVRLRSFSDYLNLRSMNSRGYLTEKEKGIWEEILRCGQIHHLYERKGNPGVYEETRSECVIRLYTHWITEEPVPACICKFIYRTYQLRELERSSGRQLYGALKAAVLKRYPYMEEELYGEESREQLVRNWYQELMKIITDYDACLHRREYQETQDIRRRVRGLFERKEWRSICYDPELFDRMFLQLSTWRELPESLIRKLCDFYMEDGPWQDPERVQFLLEHLISAWSFHRNLLEMDERTVYAYEKTSVGDIREDNRDFWEYFLTVGFDCRYVTVIGAVQRQAKYIVGNREYLPGYMRSVYLPSVEWQKRFTRFDEEEDQIGVPVYAECPVPGGGTLRLEFHLHYILYFWDGKPLIHPLLTFSQLRAAELKDAVHFFFLLAVTSIREEEQRAAEEEIGKWLNRLPLSRPTFSFLAKVLAAEASVRRISEQEVKRIQAVYYEEQERFCFKAEVSMRSVKVYRQTDVGWEEMPLLSGEGKKVKSLDLEGKKQFALGKLKELRQPKNLCIATFSLEGMTNEEKMRQVIEALKRQEQYRKREKRNIPYTPGFPWTPEEITPSVREFFAEDGGWMLESYAVLHAGKQNRKCFERVFYSAMNIFGFDLYFQSPEFAASCSRRTEALTQRIKEKHLVVGRLGWGRQYTAWRDYAPLPFAIGESGTFYACNQQKLYQADSLENLMAQVYDFSEVTRVDVYAGRLSVSRFDHTLEYCYTEEDFQTYLNSKVKLLPDMFTKFGI